MMFRTNSLVALALCGLFIANSGCRKESSTANPSSPSNPAREEMNVAYGSHKDQKMDVYFPDGWNAETPVVFVIHGGGFVAGSKEEFTTQAKLFRDEGFITINLSHRLVDSTGLTQSPPLHRTSAIKVSDELADVNTAVDKYKALAQGWGSGTAKMYMAGHSAGAILAMLYVQGDLNDDGDVRASGNLAGLTDLSIPSDTVWNQYPADFVLLYKELYYRIASYAATTANNLAFMAISPYWVTYNNPGRPNITVLPDDNDVFGVEAPNGGSHIHAVSYHALLTNRNVPNENILIEGENHGFGNRPDSWRIVVGHTTAFFRQH